MRTDLFDFDLPADLIALAPARPRDSARLLVVLPNAPLTDRSVSDLPSLLRPGDALVVNDTRVIPAALSGTRSRGDGPPAKITVTLIKRIDAARWRAFARPAKRLAAGDRIQFGSQRSLCVAGRLDATVMAKGKAGEVDLAFDVSGPALDEAIRAVGEMPLPPYIALKRGTAASDAADYQTVFAARDGAVAAPTASLHFTPELLAALDACGVTRHTVTLHVGAGTFLPVKSDDTADHQMHSEWGEVSAQTAAQLNSVRARGGRIVAAGTTALRILETSTLIDGVVQPFSGDTSIFITPGYRFRCVDALLTNFHLPRSTLFMLVSAFAGLEPMRAAYAHAVAQRYRFYSYGDATFLVRKDQKI
jgi:S-adenosylmethionine:tRNA ribosyltransferase-isomerase